MIIDDKYYPINLELSKDIIDTKIARLQKNNSLENYDIIVEFYDALIDG
jgi:hypothetical protein